MLRKIRPESVAEQVIAGALLVSIGALARYLFRTAPVWAQWGLWLLLLAAIAVATGAVAVAVVKTWRKTTATVDAWKPIAWLPNGDLDLPINPTDPWHTVWWPETRQYTHLTRAELVFMHAPPGASPAQFAACGIEIECSRGNMVIVYVSRTGRVIVYEADMDTPKDDIGRQIAAGEWITLSLAKTGHTYSVAVNGEPIWESRRRHIANSAKVDVELWPENVRARVRLSTKDPTARAVIAAFTTR